MVAVDEEDEVDDVGGRSLWPDVRGDAVDAWCYRKCYYKFAFLSRKKIK